jgi:hypothetical protein
LYNTSKMDKTTTQIFALLPTSQQQELLEKAVKGLQEKTRVIVSNLPVEKLIIAHGYLTELANGEKVREKHRPPPSYISTPDDSDIDYSDMPPLVEDTPRVVKNIYDGWGPRSNNKTMRCDTIKCQTPRNPS